MESRWEVPNGFWELEWFNEVDVPKKLLYFSRQVDFVQARLADKIQNSIHRQLLGLDISNTAPKVSDSLESDIWLTSAYMESGQNPTEEWLRELEERATIDPVLQIEAANRYN